MRSLLVLLLCLFGFAELSAQIRINAQLFRPGLSLSGYHQAGSLGASGQGTDVSRAKAGLVIPISSKLNIDPNWKKLPDILLNNKITDLKAMEQLIRPKAHQVFWTLNLNYRRYAIPSSDAVGTLQPQSEHHFYGIATGVTGIHYLKKRWFFLYTLNVGFSEDAVSIREILPYGTAAVGAGQVAGYNFVYYFGGYTFVDDFNVLAVPFFGFDARLPGRFKLNVILPLQARLTHSFPKVVDLTAFTQLQGFNTGFEPNAFFTDTIRSNMIFYSLDSGGAIRLDLGQVDLTVSGGRSTMRRTRAEDKEENTFTFENPPSWFGQVSLYFTFGKSLLDSSMGDFLDL